jgi:phage terminase large subunit GpA-like protein
MRRQNSRHPSDHEWLAQRCEALTDSMAMLSPSEWAEKKRYLPPSVTNLPGYYRFDVSPYLREIVDCLSIDSPVREISVQKGAQVCATVGILENAIGYFIDVVKSAPCMLVTADAELAKLRMESYITPMLQFSGLEPLIRSTDEKNTRKTGKTDRKIEWYGGGFLVPLGAQNANKLRSISIQMLLRDEIDGWPDKVGKDGDPIQLSAARTSAFEDSCKVVDLSTPLIKGQSKIAKRYALGDQRKYFVPCLKCGFQQELRWRVEDKDTGEVTGIVWQTDEKTGALIPGSVRYLCCNCGHAHVNEDKTRMLAPENGAQWRPTAVATKPAHRSYHISALYSPVGMQTWDACVQLWLEAWDTVRSHPRDIPKLQVFYNNVLGEPFEMRGEQVRFDVVSAHRRHEYRSGEIPNLWTSQYCGGPVLLLTCAVDVHKDNLATAVFGWCRGSRALLVEYHRFRGDTEHLDNPETWGQLRDLIEERTFIADDGKRYQIQLTLIDSGYRSDDVYRFAADYSAGVLPVKGREAPPKSALIREFSPYRTPMGTDAYGITVDIYKDRWSAALKRYWDGQGSQPEPFFNAPIDLKDAELKELTVEVKRERIDARTGQRLGFEWYRPSGAANELWDLLVYNNAGLEMIAQNVCIGQLEMKAVDWRAFYDVIEKQKLFFEEGG